jgi:NADH:ubiquinone oxidoreductase subunit
MTGQLVGQDKFGNRYFEDMDQMFSQHRRVDYRRDDFNASQVLRLVAAFADYHSLLCRLRCRQSGIAGCST